jgi:hypothetical protein
MNPFVCRLHISNMEDKIIPRHKGFLPPKDASLRVHDMVTRRSEGCQHLPTSSVSVPHRVTSSPHKH